MLVILYILLAGIILLLMLLLTCLFIPLSYSLDAVFGQMPVRLSFSLHNCCYGLKANRESKSLHWQLLLFGLNIRLKKHPSSNKQPYKPAQSQPKPALSWSGLLKLALDTSWREQIWHLLADLWCLVRPQHMLIKARIGFDEPHYTGWMMGLAGILQRQNSSYQINLEGVWDESCMEGQVVISGKLLPAKLFWQLLKFLLQPEIRSYFKQLRGHTSPSHPQAA